MSFCKAIVQRGRSLLQVPRAIRNVRAEHTKMESTHKVDSLEKKFLVWTGKYRSVAEVPDFVGQNVIERARNKMRIKITNYMMATSAVACTFIIAYFGKKEVMRQTSSLPANIEFYQPFRDEAYDD